MVPHIGWLVLECIVCPSVCLIVGGYDWQGQTRRDGGRDGGEGGGRGREGKREEERVTIYVYVDVVPMPAYHIWCLGFYRRFGRWYGYGPCLVERIVCGTAIVSQYGAAYFITTEGGLGQDGQHLILLMRVNSSCAGRLMCVEFFIIITWL